jgi:hypothetical protein
MSYDFGHHNWNERGEVRFAEVTYVFTLVLDVRDFSWADELTGVQPGTETVLLGPIELEDAGCRSLPYDLNPCLGRTRTDGPG